MAPYALLLIILTSCYFARDMQLSSRFKFLYTLLAAMTDFVTDIAYIVTQPFVSFHLWLIMLAFIFAPGLLVSITPDAQGQPGVLIEFIKGLPRFFKTVCRQIGTLHNKSGRFLRDLMKERRDNMYVWIFVPLAFVLLYAVVMPTLFVLAIAYSIICPVFIICLILLAVNTKLTMFPDLWRTFRHLITVTWDPSTALGAQRLPVPSTNGETPKAATEASKIFDINLAIQSQLICESLPQLICATRNEVLLVGWANLTSNWMYVLSASSSAVFMAEAFFQAGTWLCIKGSIYEALSVPVMPMNTEQEKMLEGERTRLRQGTLPCLTFCDTCFGEEKDDDKDDLYIA